MRGLICFSSFLFFLFFLFSANLNANRGSNRALLEAALEGDIDKAMSALLGKAQIDTEGLFKQTALHIAAGNGDKIMVKFLLQNQANIHAKDLKGKRPIHYAKRCRFSWLAKYNKNNCDEVLNFCRKECVQAHSFLAQQRDACKNIRDKGYAAADLVVLLGNKAWDRYIKLPGPRKET